MDDYTFDHEKFRDNELRNGLVILGPEPPTNKRYLKRDYTGLAALIIVSAFVGWIIGVISAKLM